MVKKYKRYGGIVVHEGAIEMAAETEDAVSSQFRRRDVSLTGAFPIGRFWVYVGLGREDEAKSKEWCSM